jgi:hypothetical protein
MPSGSFMQGFILGLGIAAGLFVVGLVAKAV